MFRMRIVRGAGVIPALCLALTVNVAFADRPEDAGPGKHRGRQEQPMHGRPYAESGPVREVHQGSYFESRDHQAVREIYGSQIAQGKCPPGLAKRANGCLPPGQSKHWSVGQPLPHDLVLYPIPIALQRRLGPPPAGHQFVRVANDILLIAIGTSMVIDAIENLGGL